ncbi:MAG: carboxypeptidase regulatory-like domain-containing protein [Candidatus Electrothrix sp. AUS1_2]|nr:carboxypeptidase regulatory-like domain-containing protein [Candidatus Electrothrix sp. AUS1_2]
MLERTMRKYFFHLLFIVLSASTVCAASLEGLVKDPAAASQPEFVVTLTPPKESSVPEQVTSTSSSGKYHLDDISPGRYMFEISYRAKVIYREVITVQGDDTKDVTLQRQ